MGELHFVDVPESLIKYAEKENWREWKEYNESRKRKCAELCGALFEDKEHHSECPFQWR